ncbi:hypothetical protein ACOSP7_002409 [Xanthoceras sorbifolium]
MAATDTNSQIDHNSGFCSQNKIFHSLRPSITLPPLSQSLSGILLTHRNLIGRLAGYFATDVFEQRATRKVSLVNRALFGSFGLITMTRGGRLQLGRLVLLEKASKLEAVLKAVHKYKTYYLAVPWSFVVEKSELTKEYDLSSLRFLLCVGATLGREVSENFKEKFPNVVIQNEAKIVDPQTGETLSPGQTGELLLMHDEWDFLIWNLLIPGYLGDEKATAEALDSEGWLKTGDLCFFYSNGYFFIVDRLKEIIKYNGYKVAPAELEHLLLSNPVIAFVFGLTLLSGYMYPDEEVGQIPMAFVVRKPETTLTEAQVMDYIAKQV